MAMGFLTKHLSLLLIATLLILFSSPKPATSTSDTHLSGWLPTISTCRGTIGDCLAEDQEFDLDSETNRRILATNKYISYGALKRNTVPCSRRGASYYNCKKGAQANPYSRGCSKITKCRS